MPLVAGVDSSTQSCTVALFDAADGSVAGEGCAPHPRAVPPVSEQHPDSWWRAFLQALGLAVEAAAEHSCATARDVSAIAVAGQCHGMVALDAYRHVLRSAKLWNDTTSAPEAERLVERLGAAEWAVAVGSVPTAAFTISKIAWLASHERSVFGRMRHVVLPHDWLTYRLTGELVTDRSEASGTGYFDGANDTWRPDLLALIDDRPDWLQALPRVCQPTEVGGQISAAAARSTGLRAGIPVGPGAGDQHAAALALAVGTHDLLLSLGTSGVALTRSDVPVADPTGQVTGVCDATGRFLPLVCTLNATQVTDLVAGLLGVSVAELGVLALADPPEHADRPVLAPFFGGERTPNLPRARGLLGGLSPDTSRESLARAAYEGVLLGLLGGADALSAVGLELCGRVLVTGGGSRSRAYLQLLADLAGREVTALTVPDATVRGAAMQAAAVSTGRTFDELHAVWGLPPAEPIVPREGAAVGSSRERFRDLAAWPGHGRRWGESR